MQKVYVQGQEKDMFMQERLGIGSASPTRWIINS